MITLLVFLKQPFVSWWGGLSFSSWFTENFPLLFQLNQRHVFYFRKRKARRGQTSTHRSKERRHRHGDSEDDTPDLERYQIKVLNFIPILFLIVICGNLIQNIFFLRPKSSFISTWMRHLELFWMRIEKGKKIELLQLVKLKKKRKRQKQ